jgi:hypothetical protein
MFFDFFSGKNIGRKQNQNNHSSHRKNISNKNSIWSAISHNGLTHNDECKTYHQQCWSGKFDMHGIHSIKDNEVETKSNQNAVSDDIKIGIFGSSDSLSLGDKQNEVEKKYSKNCYYDTSFDEVFHCL